MNRREEEESSNPEMTLVVSLMLQHDGRIVDPVPMFILCVYSAGAC